MQVISELSPLWTSMQISAMATLLAGVFGILIALKCSHLAPKQRFAWDLLLLMPLVLPPTVVGYLLLSLLSIEGPIGKLCLWLGRETLIFTPYAAAAAAAIVAFPMVYLSARAAFQQVDRQLLDAALSFGASPWRRFLDILLPLARPGLLAGLLLAFARSLGEFGATVMVAGKIPGQTETIPMRIFYAVETGDQASALLWSLLAVSLASLFLGLTQILSRR